MDLTQSLVYNETMAGRPLLRKPTENGVRLRTLRQATGLSQSQLAEQLGIPKRTLSFYEVDADHIPSSLVPPLAHALSVSVEQILGINESSTGKRGPKSQLERQIEVVSQLPRRDQQMILRLIDNTLAAAGKSHRVG